MPWSYPDNVPNAMIHFKPSIQKKAISIANRVLENTGDDGIAIATGIKKAKQMHSKVKSFKKTASLNWAEDAAEGQHNVLQQTQAMNAGIMAPKMARMKQPTTMKMNFAKVPKISAF